MIFAQTGEVSALGVSARVGAVAAVDKINAAGGVDGRKLAVSFCDDGGDVARVVTCARQLIDEGVTAVVGPITSPLSLAAAPLTEAAGIPEFGLGSATAITEPVKPYLFRASSGNQEEMETLAEWLQKEGVKRVAVLTDNGASGQDQAAILEKVLPAHGMEIVGKESYELSDTDMTAQLTRLNATGAEVLLTPGSVQQVAVIAINRKALGMTMQQVGGAGISSDSFIKLAGDAAEGIKCLGWKVSLHDKLDPADPMYAPIKEFVASLEGDVRPDQFSGLAWDSVHILAKAMEAADDPTDPKQVRDQIEATRGHVGTASTWTYGPDNHRGNDRSGFVMSELRGGAWVPLAS
ncbi:ABC transporter substrate-binding protein [Pseudonocardia thermophila]|nr:ABC transporter substrate-binding protein [Pseudonocardia thermophila]